MRIMTRTLHKKITFLALVFLLSAPTAQSGETGEAARISVMYGEKFSEFRMTNTGEARSLSFSTNSGASKTRKIASADVEYLLSKLRALPTSLEASARCNRNWIHAQYLAADGSSAKVSACLGDSTKTARGLMGVLDLLASMI